MTNFRAYATNDLAFGAFLIAAERLRFHEIELSEARGRARIVFADPDNIGDELKRKFDNGYTSVEPREFHFHLRALRKLIDDKSVSLRSARSGPPTQVAEVRTPLKGCNSNVNQHHNV